MSFLAVTTVNPLRRRPFRRARSVCQSESATSAVRFTMIVVGEGRTIESVAIYSVRIILRRRFLRDQRHSERTWRIL
jgi:hypothetical protein